MQPRSAAGTGEDWAAADENEAIKTPATPSPAKESENPCIFQPCSQHAIASKLSRCSNSLRPVVGQAFGIRDEAPNSYAFHGRGGWRQRRGRPSRQDALFATLHPEFEAVGTRQPPGCTVKVALRATGEQLALFEKDMEL